MTIPFVSRQIPSATRPSSRALAISIVVNVEEGAEMSVENGDSGPEPVDEMGVTLHSSRRNFGNESNYRYGIVEGFPRVARVLEEHATPATWTCAAVALERAPEIATFIRERGDEAASHGDRWIHQFRMEEPEERAFLERARDSIKKSVGTAPVGHLSRYLTTEKTRSLLVKTGFRYSMDDYSGDEPFWDVTENGPIVVVPYAIDTNDMKMWANAAYTPSNWLEYAITSFDELYAERRPGYRMMSLGVHLRIIGRPGRIGALRRFLKHVQSHEDIWFVRRREIAEAFAENVPEPR